MNKQWIFLVHGHVVYACCQYKEIIIMYWFISLFMMLFNIFIAQDIYEKGGKLEKIEIYIIIGLVFIIISVLIWEILAAQRCLVSERAFNAWNPSNRDDKQMLITHLSIRISYGVLVITMIGFLYMTVWEYKMVVDHKLVIIGAGLLIIAVVYWIIISACAGWWVWRCCNRVRRIRLCVVQ